MSKFILITGRTAKQGAALHKGKDSDEYRQATGFVEMGRPDREHLGIEDVIATSLEYESDRCTGRFAEGPLLKEKKREKVYDFIQTRGGGWQDCAFYSDSINDISLLESVADPVVVNPDLRLRRVARKRGWRILKFRRNVLSSKW